MFASSPLQADLGIEEATSDVSFSGVEPNGRKCELRLLVEQVDAAELQMTSANHLLQVKCLPMS